MSKKIAIIFNAPILGGAERSIVQQAKDLREHGKEINFFIPGSDNTFGPLKDFIVHEGFNPNQISYFYFPFFILNISKRSGIIRLALAISLFPFIFLLAPKELRLFDIIWANGNKAGFYSFAVSVLTQFNGTVVWHFRDYPARRFFNWLTREFFNMRQVFKFKLVANSKSVFSYIESISTQNAEIMGTYLYNPIANAQTVNHKLQRKLETIACVSMLAPWKGQHQVIIMAALYEKELKQLGIKRINIYGSQIYQTSGGHITYFQQLEKLKLKLNANLIQFKGNSSPSKIYSTIDILIHSSIKPEPFGRVITEAFLNRIPVISTSLGGAKELVLDEKTGYSYYPFDPHQLFNQISKLVHLPEKTNQISQEAFRFASEINKNARNQINKWVDSL